MNLWMGPNFIVHSPEGIVPDEHLPEDVRAAIGLLMQLNRMGCRYMVDDGRLLVSNAKHLEAELKKHKQMIIALLGPRPQEPCRGGCGKAMPAGQMCMQCATRTATEGKRL
jgi:hypothetical protein